MTLPLFLAWSGYGSSERLSNRNRPIAPELLQTAQQDSTIINSKVKEIGDATQCATEKKERLRNLTMHAGSRTKAKGVYNCTAPMIDRQEVARMAAEGIAPPARAKGLKINRGAFTAS